MTRRFLPAPSPKDVRRTRHAAWWPALTLVAASIAAPVLAAEPTAQERAQLEKQLDAARGRLDDAARDVADLTNKLYGADGHDRDVIKLRQPMPFAHGAMLGINIGGEAAGQSRAEGVEVIGVSPSGPADAAGLRKGDVITAIDGKALKKTDDRSAGRQLVEHLRGLEPGKPVKVDYLRDGRKLATTVTTVAAEPPMVRLVREHLPMLEGVELPPDFQEFVGGPRRGFRALELVPVTPKLGQYFGADKGLLVVRAPAAPGSKLEEGDVILTIGGRAPENPRHAFRILGSYQPAEQVKVEVLRQRKRLTLDMEVPQDAGAGFRSVPAVPAHPPVPPAPVAAPRNGSA